MNKLAGTLVLCALLAPASVLAGRTMTAPVTVNLEGRFAVGGLGAARNSRDKVQSIGCGFLGAPGLASGSCYATDAAGVYGTCHFINSPELAAALAMVHGDSWIRFDWNEAGVCTSINVSNTSMLEPKE